MVWLLALATVPAVLAGLALKLADGQDALRSIAVIGWTTLSGGVLLWLSDRVVPRRGRAEDWTLRDALVMGLWQAVSLIPGTSRSGITISGARHLGYTREDSARLAMLMSIPTIVASGALLATDITADAALARDAAIAAFFAFVSALAALRIMMWLLQSVNFTPYVIYRIVLGIALLAIAYG